ncbi:MAG: tetratricopeptide repeat protein [Alphaproteobacteria bacterium]|nr:tetratricopeptide repeat protein [Alphaproteobacteria bacterium]
MTTAVLRRFILLMIALIVVVVLGTQAFESFTARAPGDLNTELGVQRFEDGQHELALDYFAKALAEQPDHRGALMGRALVFIQTERYDDAVAELTYLIDFSNRTLTPEDATGRGVLAAAFANRGIVHDRIGKYEKAFADYVAALRTDEGAVDEPGLIHKVLYGIPNPSSVRNRAIYLQEQLKLPPDKRLMRVPEIDDQQRMRKP